MATRRDYGTLSKAAPRLLTPLAAPLGYLHSGGTAFARHRLDWIEGFFLQASAHGSGDFCVSIGVAVPRLDDLWQSEPKDRGFSLVAGERLTPSGVGADHWFGAANLVELQASVEALAEGLAYAEKWFARVKSMADIAGLYRRTHTVSKRDDGAHLHVLANANYGFLLLLAGDRPGAHEWLSVAVAQFEAIVAEHEAGFARRKPGKEALAYHATDVRQMNAVRAALRDAA